jgi:hypothetical protein
MFNESRIPAIKAGTYGRYELFDNAQDSGQTQDVSKPTGKPPLPERQAGLRVG